MPATLKPKSVQPISKPICLTVTVRADNAAKLGVVLRQLGIDWCAGEVGVGNFEQKGQYGDYEGRVATEPGE